jgi:hypothetical protein
LTKKLNPHELASTRNGSISNDDIPILLYHLFTCRSLQEVRTTNSHTAAVFVVVVVVVVVVSYWLLVDRNRTSKTCMYVCMYVHHAPGVDINIGSTSDNVPII